MSVWWDDVTARARGLGTHLIPDRVLDELAASPGLPELSVRLAELGWPSTGLPATSPAVLELSARREAARRLQVLARWLDARVTVMAVIFLEEDRRSIRALLRGAAAGLTAETRLAGLIPTPTLPERALEDLASRPSPREIASLLALWRHPLGPGLQAACAAEPVDLSRMELALHHAFVERAVRGARQGGPILRDFVAETIDLLNADAVLLPAGTGPGTLPDGSFLEGGRLLDHETFTRAAAAGTPAEARRLLAAVFRATPIGAVIGPGGPRLAALEPALLEARIRIWHRRAHLEPAGVAPVLDYTLRLRAQLLRLRGIIWGAALGVPPSIRKRPLAGV